MDAGASGPKGQQSDDGPPLTDSPVYTAATMNSNPQIAHGLEVQS